MELLELLEFEMVIDELVLKLVVDTVRNLD